MATFVDLPSTIRRLFDELYQVVADVEPGRRGCNIVVYLDEQPTIEVGVEIKASFVARNRVRASATPRGRVATFTHVGRYEDLPTSHVAMRAACRDHGLELAGPTWERYGDWTNDPRELRTEIFYLLR